jgi:hypothetical protein
MSVTESEVEITHESIFQMALSLSKDDQWELVQELLSLLKGAKPAKAAKAAKAKKAKKEKDPSAPKRPMSPYMELLNKFVWPILKDHSESVEDAEEKKHLRSVSARTQVASTLWDTIKSKDEFASITKEKIIAVYQDLKTNPRPPKAAKASPASSPAPSDDEAVPAPVEEKVKEKEKEKENTKPAKAAKATEDDFADEKKEWSYRNKKYMRLMNYLWDMEDKWVGEWDPATKKINKDAEEPVIEYE